MRGGGIKHSSRSKVALFVPDLEGGGAERMMVNLANEFAARGLGVDLVLARKKGVYLDLVRDNVNLVDMDTSFFSPLVLLRLAAYLKAAKPVSLLSAMTYPNVAAVIANLMAFKPARVVMSERVTLRVQSSRSTSAKEKLKPLAARLIYRWADGVVAISGGVAQDLAAVTKIDPQRINVIYNPVVTPDLLEKQRLPDHEYFKVEGGPIVLAAGRLVPQKDFSTLVKAFKEVRQIVDARLIILGEGVLRGALSKQVDSLGLEQYVSLPGYVNNPFDYMQNADLFVLSSAWEGFGNVLVEAMALGCPVVSTRCPSGPAEILDNGRYGELVEIGDYNGLAKAMLTALKAPVSSEILRARAIDFTVEKVADKYLYMLLGEVR